MGRELFDQYRVWKVWGVDLGAPNKDAEDVIQETIGVEDIKTIPKVIFGWFLASVVFAGLTLVTSAMALCTRWAKGVAVFFSVVGTVCGLVIATLAQLLFPTLVRRVHDFHVVAKNGAGGGTLTAILGWHALLGLWLIAVFSFLSTLLLAATLHSDRKSRAMGGLSKEKDSRLKGYGLSNEIGESSKSPAVTRRAIPHGTNPYGMPGIIRRATGKLFGAAGISRYEDTSYETLRAVREDRGRSRSRGGSKSRHGSPGEKSIEVIGASREEDGGGRDARYEPYRHNETA